MPNIVLSGYLEDDYLDAPEPYLGGSVLHGVRSQVDLRIDSSHSVKSEVERRVDATHSVYSQSEHAINALHAVNSQIESRIDYNNAVLEQIDMQLGDQPNAIGQQVDQVIINTHIILSQVERRLDKIHPVYSQIDRKINLASKTLRSEIRRGTVLHIDNCFPGYLEGGYGEDSYLAAKMCAQMRSQVARTLNKLDIVHEQIEQRIDSSKAIRSQVERRIDALHTVHEQIDRLRAQLIHSQISQVLYNTNNLRILCEFPSRGTSGTNWTSNSTETGDFSPYNLNTDIVEQVWRSASGVKTGIILTCDTEIAQGAFADTLAFLNHNLTTSASVVWQRSNDPAFTTVDTIVLSSFLEAPRAGESNLYWIAPELPAVSYRYHRFLINDITNTADNLQIGTIVFGTSSIFQGECFVDQVQRRTTHFSDKIQTEGFTNVSNDRSLKFGVTLEFRNLRFNKGNYNRLRSVFEEARTSLKCLWIPTPQYPSRFAAFAKLTSIPIENHNDRGEDHDYVSFTIDIDESL